MSAQTAIAILDSMFDLFKEMAARHRPRPELARHRPAPSAGPGAGRLVGRSGLRRHKLKAHAAHYAATYRPRSAREAISKANADRLDDVVRHYSILRAHLEQQLPAS